MNKKKTKKEQTASLNVFVRDHRQRELHLRAFEDKHSCRSLPRTNFPTVNDDRAMDSTVVDEKTSNDLVESSSLRIVR